MSLWILALAIGLCLGFAGMTGAQTPDGDTPAEEDICAGEIGAAFGLCNAYCEAMDCDSDNPSASAKACGKVFGKFEQITGTVLPCEITCPCFTAEDLLEGGAINECGENFPGFPNLAGVRYADGGLACSGESCATVAPGVLSCGISTLSDLVFEIGISPDDDVSCRLLILQNCDNPNLTASEATAAQDSSSVLFMLILNCTYTHTHTHTHTHIYIYIYI